MLSSICLKLKSYISCNILSFSTDLKFFKKKAKWIKNKDNLSENVSDEFKLKYNFLLVVNLINLL